MSLLLQKIIEIVGLNPPEELTIFIESILYHGILSKEEVANLHDFAQIHRGFGPWELAEGEVEGLFLGLEVVGHDHVLIVHEEHLVIREEVREVVVRLVMDHLDLQLDHLALHRHLLLLHLQVLYLRIYGILLCGIQEHSKLHFMLFDLFGPLPFIEVFDLEVVVVLVDDDVLVRQSMAILFETENWSIFNCENPKVALKHLEARNPQ